PLVRLNRVTSSFWAPFERVLSPNEKSGPNLFPQSSTIIDPPACFRPTVLLFSRPNPKWLAEKVSAMTVFEQIIRATNMVNFKIKVLLAVRPYRRGESNV